MASLFERVKNRKLVQWLLAYLMASWVILQVLDTLADVVSFVDAIRPTLLIVLVLGIPVVLVLAWYHGEQGRQRVSGPELLILATLFAGLAAALALLGRADEEDRVSASPTRFPGVAPAAPAIAVLPAVAAGSDAAEIGEGVVTLLSTGLDAVPGWRAVSPRTVRARWTERVPEGTWADETTALEIARATGGRFAVLPTATVLGSTVRISAELIDLEEPAATPTAIDVEGSSENLLPLVDELAVRVLGAVLQGAGEIPAIDLSEASTASPEAMRAFLRGEVAYRKYRLEEARDAFNLALERDPGFARAHYRLLEVHSWGVTYDDQKRAEHLAAAYEHIDRLTEREALVVRGWSASDRQEGLRWLREAVSKYPEDATGWYMLGEMLAHRLELFATLDEIREPFERAIELDPYRAVLYPHPTEFAFGERPDSARATELVSRYLAAASGVEGRPTIDIDPRGGELALELAFGDSLTKARARRRLEDEVANARFETLTETAGYLAHPRYWDQRAPLVESFIANPDVNPLNRVFHARLEALWRGRVARALGQSMDALLESRVGVDAVYTAGIMGLPIHTELLDVAVGPAHIRADAESWRLSLAGFHAADEGRWADHQRVLSLLGDRIEPDAREPTSIQTAGSDAGWLETVRAYGVWKRGQPERALAVLSDVTSPGKPATEIVLWHLGQLYLELERWADAERVFNTAATGGISSPPFNWNPLARRNLAIALEAQGKDAEAAEAYRYFVENWADSDPELQPLVDEARAAIRRLDPSDDE